MICRSGAGSGATLVLAQGTHWRQHFEKHLGTTTVLSMAPLPFPRIAAGIDMILVSCSEKVQRTAMHEIM